MGTHLLFRVHVASGVEHRDEQGILGKGKIASPLAW